MCIRDRPGDLPYEVFNVSTDDALSVDEIAAAACRASGLDPAAVVFDHTGGRGGWNGDVPVVRLDTSRIRSRGWAPKRSSAAAMEWALASMADALTDGADGDRPGG